ncbi:MULTISPECIES: hypothetical protein [Pseudomonas]|uniref:Prephenate dehydratase n=1 Tax=Pseudomonas cedrina TaxID=651740 RepID=A0A2S9CUN9_PSECE|nr:MULTISPECIES: hypothetical protein [Pseudomonas]AVJ24091.1 hypothetical protein CLM72_21125 [Pseudomonas sp. MYb193]PRB84212.1 hypothetical protein CQ006_27975 [Pseudomonas cedrina]
MNADSLNAIEVIHTLGPAGTNCEKAANEWYKRQGRTGEVKLYQTLEKALEQMPKNPSHALLGCIVYPELHTLVFSNLKTLTLSDCFIMHTFNMVLAARNEGPVSSVATHPAPQLLVSTDYKKSIVTSNSEAAIQCANGLVDACITTLPSAKNNNLHIKEDFGEVPMGFSIHTVK